MSQQMMSTGRPLSSAKTRTGPPVQDRLLAEVEKRKENKEKIKRDLDLEEMKECSF